MNSKFKIRGLHHIKLTVTDLTRSRQFYASLPGFQTVAEDPDFVMFPVGEMNVGLTAQRGRRSSDRFDEFTIGHDRFALEVNSETDLTAAVAFLDEQGINHSEIKSL